MSRMEQAVILTYFEYLAIFWEIFNFLKNPKGGPFYAKNVFIPDFSQISCVEFLGHKSIKFQVS